MNINILPIGKAPTSLEIPHFPALFQAVIFRNWNMVPPERIAAALDSTADDVLKHAAKLGLDVPPAVSEQWLKRGYVSLIRTNWQLLNYDAMLKLLDWTPEKLLDVLQNEDFLWIKLGSLKPQCPSVSCRELTEDEEKATANICEIVKKYRADKDFEEPFAFVNKFASFAPAKIQKSDELYIAYSYSALYGDSLAMPELDPYPESLLNALASKGINAIWLPGILYQLHYWADAPELSKNYEKRLESLSALIKKAAKYGMKVFLYLNEPRGLPIGQFKNNAAVREKYLEVENLSQNLYSMCTSKKAVLDYLYNAVKSLFSAVPELGGAFMISQSEYLTHCASRHDNAEKCPCPRCSKRKSPEIIAEVIRTVAEAATSVAPNAQIISWDWAWDKEWIPEICPELPSNTAIMAVSESQVPVEFDGVKTIVRDYSLSHCGPGEKSKRTWKIASECGLKNFAKIQVSTTWEASAVPYLPVTELLDEHLKKLREIGIKNYVTSWTLGGYPSINMDLLQMSHDEMIIKNFGLKAKDSIGRALHKFSEAFKNFPFDLEVVYNAPHNIGAANLLYGKPTNFKATMVGIPYDDMVTWCGPYPPETFCKYLSILCDIWDEGLKILENAKADITPEFENNYQDLYSVAHACYCHYASTVNQVRYINIFRDSDRIQERHELLDDEIKLASKMLSLARKDSRLGFEATNHYAYTHNELLEKIINCEYLNRN